MSACVSIHGLEAKMKHSIHGNARLALVLILCASVYVQPLGAQTLPNVGDDVLKQMSAVLHVDVQTGRIAGISGSGPVAEIGAKIVDVLFGDYAAGEWIGFAQPVQGEYVKPAISARLLILRRDGGAPLLDTEYSAAARDALASRVSEYRRKAELLTGDRHVPDYLLRSAQNALLHVEIQQTAPFDRGRGNLSATQTAVVRAVVQGDFKPGQTVQYIEESRRHKRFEPPANAQRIVLLHHSRSVQDGQMKWWLHERVDYGFTQEGWRTLQADLARVRAAQAEKTSREAPR